MSYGYGGRPSRGPGGYEEVNDYNSGNPYDNRGRNDGNNVEMGSYNQYSRGPAPAAPPSDPNAMLNECRDIDRGIDKIEQNLKQLRMLQDRSLNEADNGASSTARQVDALSSETMAMYRELTDRVRRLKSSPEANSPRNGPQIGRIDRRLKEAIQQYQQVEAAFRKKTQDQMARQYRIVRPEAAESEVRAAVEDVSGAGNQVFQQAMMQSSRQGQARAVLNAVQDRHAALQRIEQQMIELAQLFQDMDTLIVQQEASVVNIEQKGDEVVEHLDKGNQEIETAVTTARSTRKKKWWCCGITVAIVLIVAIIVVVYFLVIKPPSSNSGKRSVETGLEGRSVTDEAWTAQEAASLAARYIGGSRGLRAFAGRMLVPVQRR